METSSSADSQAISGSANTLSIAFRDLLPFGGDDVSAFISAAAASLGQREADLARRMGVSRATVSSWKHRSAIPDQQARWFSLELIPAIFRSDELLYLSGAENSGVAIALAVFKQTDFDPYRNFFDGEVRKMVLCTRNISALSRLGMFVLSRLRHEGEQMTKDDFVWYRVVPKVIELARLGTQAVRE